MSKYKNFEISELDSPDLLNSHVNVDVMLLTKLESIGNAVGHKLKINSGYRTASHNKDVGGSSTSSHMRGYAADIACNSSRDRFLIIEAAIMLHITRIGIYRTFVHIDIDPAKDKQVIWY